MKAAVISRIGQPIAPNIQVVNDWPEPKAGPGEVVVRTEASALNHRDLYLARGMPGRELNYPIVTGEDGCGVVESVGNGVDESWVGRRVIVNAAVPVANPIVPDAQPAIPDRKMIGEYISGTLAEKFAAPVSNVLDVGDCDPQEAAAFGLVHLTAWRMLWTRARLVPGQWVLITGIGGGVALACLNIAKHLGCNTIVTSRHQWKLDKACQLGADHAILDSGEDWSREVRTITGKRGVNVCADSVGKAIHMSCVKSLARGGIFVTCGTTSGPDATTDLARLFWNQLTFLGSTMGDMNEFRQVVALFRQGAMKPVIDKVYDAADAAEAFARLESGEQFGKVVLRWT